MQMYIKMPYNRKLFVKYDKYVYKLCNISLFDEFVYLS